MYYIIYQTTNLVNSKFYIGKHQTKDLNDDYLGSGRKIVEAIKKYGRNNFKKEILYICSSEHEMNEKEKELISEEFVNRKDTYNIGIGGEGGPHFRGKTHSEDTKIKLSNASRGNTSAIGRTPWNKGKMQTEEHKNKISSSMKDYHATRAVR